LFAVLYDTGMRVGEALGLRHEDWAIAKRHVTVTARSNDNGARSKSVRPWETPWMTRFDNTFGRNQPMIA